MLQAILQEIEMRKHELNNQSIQTIYFGGGTPGILPSDDIKKIMHAIEDNFIVEKNIETTLEVNPDDMHPQKLKAYLDMGINRLSVGTQSFFEEDLQYMNRSHDAKAAARCVQEAQDTGFNNISVDLIYGFPLLTNEKWKQNINTALALQITHLSCYAMTVEARTALEKMIRTEKLPPINHAQSAEQFEWLMHAIEDAGWEHYEISNFAKPNHRAVHNTNYWLGKHYLGIGPSAHSFDGSSRSWNIVNNALFIKSIEEHILPSEKEILTLHQQINEYIMTSLRMSDGMQLQKIKPKVIISGPEDGRQPTTKPVIPIAAKTTIFNTPSPKVRPNTTADLEIGRDLKRSINPFCISADNPTAVEASVKATVCTNIPGISNCT